MIDLNSNDPFNSSTPGLQSGTYIDGSTVFPGTGFYSEYYGNHVARISLTSKKGRGAYAAYSSSPTEMFNVTGAKYFYNDPHLNWITTNGRKVADVKEPLSVITSWLDLLLVVRVNLTDDSRKVYQQIGYYQINHKRVIVWDRRISVYNESGNFDILTCSGSSSSDHSTSTTQPTSDFSCGRLNLF